MGEEVKIAELIERLKAEGPSRERDADIYILLQIPHDRVGRIDRLGGCVGWWPKDAPYQSALEVPSYTGDLSAALALTLTTLPGWMISINMGIGKTVAYVRDKSILCEDKIEGDGYSDSPSTALCIALLTALTRK